MKTTFNHNSLLKILGVAITFVLSYRLNQILFDDTSLHIFPGASLIFLPSFVKLSAVILFNWFGLFGILLATLYIEIVANRPTESIIFTLFVFGCAPMFALIATKKLFAIPDTLVNLKYYHIILMSGIAASFGIINGALGWGDMAVGYAIAAGDFSTDLIMLFSLSVIMRGWEFFTRKSRNV